MAAALAEGFSSPSGGAARSGGGGASPAIQGGSAGGTEAGWPGNTYDADGVRAPTEYTTGEEKYLGVLE